MAQAAAGSDVLARPPCEWPKSSGRRRGIRGRSGSRRCCRCGFGGRAQVPELTAEVEAQLLKMSARQLDRQQRTRQHLDPFTLSRALEHALDHLNTLRKNSHNTPAMNTGT